MSMFEPIRTHIKSFPEKAIIWFPWGEVIDMIMLPFILQVSRNIDLVYGGGSIGLMGLVSQAVHDGGRHVIG